jgi:predicted NAD/FAD-dependent oxidoreductase
MPLDPAAVGAAFAAAVNMSADEIEAWLETPESRRVGFTRPGEDESVGRQAGRRIAAILRSEPSALDDEDLRLMRKAIGVVRRHRAQEPENMVTSRWRYALMNWGHDPLR